MPRPRRAADGRGRFCAIAFEAPAIEEAVRELSQRDIPHTPVAPYVERGAAVDQAHRHLEQRRPALLQLQMRAFEVLRPRLDAMRVAWRAWADAWAARSAMACRSFMAVSALTSLVANARAESS